MSRYRRDWAVTYASSLGGRTPDVAEAVRSIRRREAIFARPAESTVDADISPISTSASMEVDIAEGMAVRQSSIQGCLCFV